MKVRGLDEETTVHTHFIHVHGCKYVVPTTKIAIGSLPSDILDDWSVRWEGGKPKQAREEGWYKMCTVITLRGWTAPQPFVPWRQARPGRAGPGQARSCIFQSPFFLTFSKGNLFSFVPFLFFSFKHIRKRLTGLHFSLSVARACVCGVCGDSTTGQHCHGLRKGESWCEWAKFSSVL